MPRTHNGVDNDQVQPVYVLHVVLKVSANWAKLLHSLALQCQIWLFEIQKRLINNLKTFYSTPPLFSAIFTSYSKCIYSTDEKNIQLQVHF